MIRGDFLLKAASLLIALLLAYGVHSSSNVSVVSLFVPIELKNAPEEKAVVKPVKRGAQVTLKGPSFLIGPVASAPPPIRVKIPENQEDRVTVSLKASDLSLPTSVEVVSIEPSQVEFVFEPLERRELKVEVPRIGQLPNGLVLEGIEVSPKNVGVRGPRGEVRQMRVAEAEAIDLSQVAESTEIVANLRSNNSSVTFSTKSVVVKVVVGKVPSQRELSQVPLEVRTRRELGSFSVNPSEVSIKFAGSPEDLAKVRPESVIPFVRIAEPLGERGAKLKVMADVPNGIKVVAIEPAEVSVESQQVSAEKTTSAKKVKAKK